MLTFQYYLLGFLDTVAGHFMLVSYLLAVTDEQAVWSRLKKLPPLSLSPVIAFLLSLGLSAVLEVGILRYFIMSFVTLVMCSLCVTWAWRWDIWRAFSAVCMAGILQVASSGILPPGR